MEISEELLHGFPQQLRHFPFSSAVHKGSKSQHISPTLIFWFFCLDMNVFKI
jgi:hypothetical protein